MGAGHQSQISSGREALAQPCGGKDSHECYPEAEAPEDISHSDMIFSGYTKGEPQGEEDEEAAEKRPGEEPGPAKVTAFEKPVETDTYEPPERQAVDRIDDSAPGLNGHAGGCPGPGPRGRESGKWQFDSYCREIDGLDHVRQVRSRSNHGETQEAFARYRDLSQAGRKTNGWSATRA